MAYFFLYGFDISKPSERPTGRDREAYPDFEPVCTVDMKVGVGTGEGSTAKETKILKLALGDEPLHVDADDLHEVLQTQGALRKPGVRIELPTKSVGYWKERTSEQVAEGYFKGLWTKTHGPVLDVYRYGFEVHDGLRTKKLHETQVVRQFLINHRNGADATAYSHGKPAYMAMLAKASDRKRWADRMQSLATATQVLLDAGVDMARVARMCREPEKYLQPVLKRRGASADLVKSSRYGSWDSLREGIGLIFDIRSYYAVRDHQLAVLRALGTDVQSGVIQIDVE